MPKQKKHFRGRLTTMEACDVLRCSRENFRVQYAPLADETIREARGNAWVYDFPALL